MHYKHNQIFTDHVIPPDADVIEFDARVRGWDELHEYLYGAPERVRQQAEATIADRADQSPAA